MLTILFMMTCSAFDGVLVPQEPERFLLEPGVEAELAWQAMGLFPEEAVSAQIIDYAGDVVQELNATVDGSRVVLRFTPQRGYVDIHFPDFEQTFGIVALDSAPEARDRFFGVDAAMSWLVQSDAERASIIKMMDWLGISIVRERINWSAIEPVRSQFNWETDHRYESFRRDLAAHGLEVLDVFHDAPVWAGRTEKNPYPNDLLAAAASWQQIGDRWGAMWGGIEIWNEPDIHFGGDLPADQYVAVAKAVANGLLASNYDGPIVQGVFTHLVSRSVLDPFADSGLLDAGHIMSFHDYRSVGAIEELTVLFRDWLDDHHHPRMPLWISECGWPWDRGPGRPPRDQDAESAHISIGKAIEARAVGIERHFTFVLPFYEENDRNFGMLARDVTPLRAFGAYAQAIRALSNHRYVGDWVDGQMEHVRTPVFVHGEDAVLVIVAEREGAQFILDGAIVPRAVVGIDGRELVLASNGAVPLHDGMAYLHFVAEDIEASIDDDTASARLFQLGDEPEPGEPSFFPVVLQHLPDLDVVGATSRRYHVDEAGKDHRLSLRINNFDDAPRHLRIAIEDEDGTVGAEESIAVEARAYAEHAWTLDLTPYGEGPHKTLFLNAYDATDGHRLDRLRIDFEVTLTLEQSIKTYPHVQPIPIDDLAYWAPNIVGDGTMDMMVDDEGNWRMEAAFGEQDPWAFPILQIPDEVDMTKGEAVVIRARMEQPGIFRIMLRHSDGVMFTTSFSVVPAGGEWHVRTVWFDELDMLPMNVPPGHPGTLDLEDVETFSVGLNSHTQENAIEVSHFFVVGGE